MGGNNTCLVKCWYKCKDFYNVVQRNKERKRFLYHW